MNQALERCVLILEQERQEIDTALHLLRGRTVAAPTNHQPKQHPNKGKKWTEEQRQKFKATMAKLRNKKQKK